ncbi:MAG TPA: carboxypeptidase-like regulatory domain-containing protein, partial [Rariglobus sp.]|nr:carboxypeptidase-like regulatory domain-containing protein [Rariglobus sp.]
TKSCWIHGRRLIGIASLLGAVILSAAPKATGEHDTPELAAKRIAEISALIPSGEGELDDQGLLKSLGRQSTPDTIRPETGRIEIRLKNEGSDSKLLNGWLRYETDTGLDQGCIRIIWASGIVRVNGGRATITLRGNDRRVILYAEGLPGYRLAQKNQFGLSASTALTLPPNTNLLEAEIPVTAAGAIRWRIMSETGLPETEPLKLWYYGADFSTSDKKMDPPYRRLLIRPAFFHEKYRIVIQKGARLAFSSPAPLTLQNPVSDEVVAFVPGVTVSGRILDEKGVPVSGLTFALRYQMIKKQPTMTETVAEVMTDKSGDFRFENINPDMPNPYWLQLSTADTGGPTATPPYRFEINPRSSQPIELRLPAMYPAMGRLLHAKTGKPVVGAKLRAYVRSHLSPTGRPAGLPIFTVPAELPTDETGAFKFSHLPIGIYDFYIESGRIVRDGKDIPALQVSPNDNPNMDLMHVPQNPGEPLVLWFSE